MVDNAAKAGSGSATGVLVRLVGDRTSADSDHRPPLRTGWAAVLAVSSGLTMVAAFAPFDQWWAAPIGVAMLTLAVYGRRGRAGAGLGLLAGLSFFVPLLSWAGGYVGPVWLLLPAMEAGYLALLGALTALTGPVLRKWTWSWPLVTGAGWTLQEALRSRTPFGGFPWGRLAFSQADSPLAHLAQLGGAPLVTFATAAIGGLLAAAMWAALDRRAWVSRVVMPVGVALLLVAAAYVVPPPTANDRAVTVAIVQGNVPRLGLDFNAQRRAVLDNHVDATIALAAEVAAGRRPAPDLVVWPENASDIDPLANADAGARIDAAARAIGAPILVGGLLNGPGEQSRNVGIVWDPVAGPGQIYVKRHPVPFAEYIPLRRIARLVSDKVDLVRHDLMAGPSAGVLRIGPAIVGDVICFEVADDGVVRDTVTGGANLLVVQTNNATFNVAEARQQLAMVRLRAIEHGRPALMASTVGVSGFVGPDGRVSDSTEFNTAAIVVREMRLGATRTIATELGALPELALAGLAVVLLSLALGLAARSIVGPNGWRRPRQISHLLGKHPRRRNGSPDDECGGRDEATGLRRVDSLEGTVVD